MTSVVEHQGHKLRVCAGILLEVAQAGRSGLLAGTAGGSEIELDAAYDTAEILDSSIAYGFVACGDSCVQLLLQFSLS